MRSSGLSASVEPAGLLRRAGSKDLGAFVAAGSADVAYLDPPFKVERSFGARLEAGSSRAGGPIPARSSSIHSAARGRRSSPRPRPRGASPAAMWAISRSRPRKHASTRRAFTTTDHDAVSDLPADGWQGRARRRGRRVAERKIRDLVDAGAKVRVVALDATPDVEALAASGSIALARRAFLESDVGGAWLVVAATADADVQRRACAAADAARVFAIAVEDPPNGSAYSGSVVRRGPMTVAISSTGEAPALTRLLREILEQALPEPDWIEAARALREKWRSEGTPMASRFAELVRAFKERA